MCNEYNAEYDRSFLPKISDPGLVPFLDRIWEVYAKFDGLQLSSLAHMEGTPWYDMKEMYGEKNLNGKVIPNKLIGEYYKKQLIDS